jgi:hypothetical protein
MPYLNLDFEYFSHPKTVRLVSLLGKGAEMLPIRLWIYTGKFYSESGILSDHSAGEIESLVGWWGKEGVMVAAMVKVGFLRQEGSGYHVHDFSQHQGHIQDFKERAKKGAAERWARYRAASSNASSITKQCPVPNLLIPNQTIKRDFGLGMPFEPEFLKFWDAYPRKLGQKAASDAWNALSPSPEQVIEIMGALAQHKLVWTDPQFIPAPGKWLSEHRWKDDLSRPGHGEAEKDRKLSEAYFKEVE